MVYSRFITFLITLSFFLFLPSTVLAKTKVAVVGSSSYDAGCNSSFGFVKKLRKSLPDIEFDCFTKVGASASFFLDQYNDNVKGKGYSDIIVFGGLNGLNNDNGLKSTQSNLSKIFQSAEAEKVRVIVTGSQPFKGYSSWTNTWGDNLKTNNAWVATKPHGVDVFVDIYPFVDKNKDDALDSEFDSGDHLHMSGKGHDILYNEVLKNAYSGTPIASAGSGSTPATEISADEIKKIVQAPQPRIKIPGLNFTKPEDTQNLARKEIGLDGKEGIYISIPFLGEYLGAVYRLAVVSASILAVIFIIIAGFIWTTSAGSSQRIDTAKKMIERSLTGLIIAVSSYVILFAINPDLVKFKNLKILYIPGDPLGDLVYDEGDTNTPDDHTGKPFGSTVYDDTFKKFSVCSGMNWELYKAIAHHESGLNAGIMNKGGSSATGLFQCMDGKDHRTCKRVLKAVGWENKCDDPGLKDPEVNTAYATQIFKSNASTINGRCEKGSFEDKVFMLYFGHSSGPGALGAGITQWGCSISDWPKEGNWPEETRLKSIRGQKIYRGASYSYIQKIVTKIKGFDISAFEGPKNKSECPLK